MSSGLLLILPIVLVLVLANGLFVAAEFAILGAPRATLTAKAQAGDPVAARLDRTLSDPRRLDRYIATAQVGITLASLGLGMYGEHALAQWLEPHLAGLGPLRTAGAHVAASAAAVAVLTYLHIVAGEMVPKAVALQHAEDSARRLDTPMRVMGIVFLPIVATLNAAGNGILRMLGIRREQAASRIHSPEELQAVVEESRTSGAIRQEEGRLLRETLQFSDITAGEAMVPRVLVAGIPHDADEGAVDAIVKGAPHTRFPVYDGDLDHILGVVHVRDLMHGPLEGALHPVPFVPETSPLDHVLATMRAAGAHMAVVMDEHGGTAGVLSMEDLMEEIVGEIDEGPRGRMARRREGDAWHVPGAMRWDEVGDLIGRPLSHPEVDTVGGLVLEAIGRPPRIGDATERQGVRVEVTEVVGRGVRMCRVRDLEASRRSDA